jgi:hypothetical protein
VPHRARRCSGGPDLSPRLLLHRGDCGVRIEDVSVFDDEVARPTAQYPPAQITPAEFETFTTSLFAALEETGNISDLRVQNHEVIQGVDGCIRSSSPLVRTRPS